MNSRVQSRRSAESVNKLCPAVSELVAAIVADVHFAGAILDCTRVLAEVAVHEIGCSDIVRLCSMVVGGVQGCCAAWLWRRSKVVVHEIRCSGRL